MNPIEFLFQLFRKFGAFTPGRFETLHGKANNWYNDYRVKDGKLNKLVDKWGEDWRVQLLFSALYVIGIKVIANWQMGREEIDLDGELDDTETERDLHTRGKFGLN